MSSDQTITDDIMPSAAPSEDEIRRWNALPADEQLRRLRLAVAEGMTSPRSDKPIEDVLVEARRKARLLRPDNG